MLNLDFEYGTEIIDEIFRQKEEKELVNLYYYGNMNGYNTGYKTFENFKKAVIPETSGNILNKNLTVDEIMGQVKNTLDLFTGGRT